MANWIENVFAYLKESEKTVLINKSGSTPNSSMEKIRSGQSYLYKKYGMESEVIDVRLFDNVLGGCLGQALCQTMKRYPYFNTKLIEKNGDFYIVQNDVSINVRKTNKLVRLGSIACNYHLIDITYFGKSIYIAFHHALCDGRGIKPFVETLLWYYCSYRYSNNGQVNGIRYAGEPLLDGETMDPFMKEYSFDKSKDYISLSRDSYAIPEGEKAETLTGYRYEIKMKNSDFMRVCKQYNATPVILTAITMSKAIADMYPDFDKQINANIATDMRTALGADNTFKNCVKSMILPYDRDFALLSPVEQGAKYRKILNSQRDADYCRREAMAMMGLFNKLDSLDSYEEKQKIMGFFEGMVLNTYVISYLGDFILGNNKEHIESIHLYNSGTTGLGINMISCGDKFVFDFKQSFPSSKYVDAFCKVIESYDIEYEKSCVIEFETPCDSVIKRKQQPVVVIKGKKSMANFLKKAFQDMSENAKEQRKVSKAEFEAAKAESRANFAEAKAMGKPETRKKLEQKKRDEQLVAAKARTAEAQARIDATK